MGIYNVHYKIEMRNPDRSEYPLGAQAVEDEIGEISEVHLDSAIEKKIMIHRIGSLCISIIAGIEMPLLMNHALLPLHGHLPVYATIPLMPVCVICWWVVFSRMISARFIKPCLILNLPSGVREKGIVKIIRYSRIK